MRERPLSAVPRPALLLLALGFCAQLLWHFSHPDAPPRAENLPPAPSLTALQLASLGEPVALSKLLLLYIQGFDDQPGVQTPFRQLDFHQVENWLAVTLQLDPRSQYPLYLASHVYSEVGDPVKQRIMFAFVYRQFFADPNARWESLANAAIMTRHHLQDLPLAQQYAEAIRLHTSAAAAPDWARQMDIFMLEDLHHYDRALQLLDAVLADDQINNVNERDFLLSRRAQIVAKIGH